MSNLKYKIEKDKHYSKLISGGIKPLFYIGKINHEYTVIFDQSCIYDERELSYSGINKLLGFTRIHHQESIPIFKCLCNSWLIGWKCSYEEYEPALILYSYYDYNGIEYRIPVEYKFEFNKPIIIKVIEYSNRIKWYIEQGYYDICFTQNKGMNNPKIGYHLHPYFGGKSTAPHDMFIEIKD
jgi:hypothetical protein